MLDTWQWEHLWLMRAGGNQAAQEFFSKHWGPSMSKDALTKYRSKAALQYKKQLTERAKKMQESHNVNEDTEQELSLIDFSSTPSQQNGTTLTKEEEDFFSGWEAPERQNAVTQPSTAQANVGGPKAKVNLSTVSHTRVQQKNKPMKLGARRHADFNFEAAQAREKQETVMAEEVAQTAIAQPVSSRLAYADDFNNSRSHDILEVSKVTSNSASVESPKRFGGFGFVPDANTVANTAPLSSRITGMGSRLDVDEHTAARDRFSNAKSISSDQYFQRGQYDSSLGAENNARIAQFQGSNSISSDQYFGRPEFNESSRKPSAEFDAGEVTKKFLRGAARGASKLQRMLSDMERRY